ncbi:MAG: hypothetical protein ABIT10_03655 [Alteraurantiacibacter sp.]
MNRATAIVIACVPAALSLAGCATPSTQFPSLAIRDSERVSGTLAAPATPVAPPAPVAPATLAQLDRLLATMRASHAAFTAATPAAQRAVANARGAAVGSDSWSAAQVAVAGLESSRSEGMIALGDLDRLFVDAAVAGGEFAQVETARLEADRLEAEETAEIERLLGALAN